MVDRGVAAVAPVGGIRAISRYQWLVFFVVWAGWTLAVPDPNSLDRRRLLHRQRSRCHELRTARGGPFGGAFGGSFNNVTAFMTCFAVLSIIAMLLGRETKDAGLPR